MSARNTRLIAIDNNTEVELERLRKEIQRNFGKVPTKKFAAYVMSRKSNSFRLNIQEMRGLIVGYRDRVWL